MTLVTPWKHVPQDFALVVSPTLRAQPVAVSMALLAWQLLEGPLPRFLRCAGLALHGHALATHGPLALSPCTTTPSRHMVR